MWTESRLSFPTLICTGEWGVSAIVQDDAGEVPPLTQVQFGPIALAEGVRPGHVVAFACVAICSLSLYVFVNFMQPYLLHGQIEVAATTTGRLTSHLSVMQEILVLACVGPIGAVSDIVGRRTVFAIGLLVVAFGLVLFSYAATVPELFGARGVFAFGTAATTATLAAVAADYPDNAARGKFLGLMLITQQLAILLLVATIAARLPAWLVASGIGAVPAGQITFRAAAAFGLLGAVLAWRCLARKTVSTHTARKNPFASLALIAAHIRRHPPYSVVVAVAFVARGDAAIMSGFLSLWVVRSAGAAGITAAQAMHSAGVLLSSVTVCGMVSACIAGFAADRISRIAALAAALVIAGAGNILLLAVHDVTHWPAILLIGLIAAAETAIVVFGQALLGEQTPAELRGAAVGVFSICGSLGVLILVFAGGVLFDLVSGAAPFAMLGAVNVIAGISALVVWRG
jgi:MFS family permease